MKVEDMNGAELADALERDCSYDLDDPIPYLREAARRLRALGALTEAIGWARKRLDDRALRCQSGEIQDGGREWQRAIWGAFSDVDTVLEAFPEPVALEPVAWRFPNDTNTIWEYTRDEEHADEMRRRRGCAEPLYTLLSDGEANCG